MVNRYLYDVYGETVESEFPIPELIEAKDGAIPTIRVVCEKVPDDILEKLREVRSVYTKEWIVFTIDNVGYFYDHFVDGIMTISIHLKDDFSEYSRKTFTLGSGMGLALLLKNRIAIHSGTVVYNDKAIIVTGDSGAGKSTITTALRLSGMKFLADDVSVLGHDGEGEFIVNHAYPQQKLCRDAALALGYNLDDLIYINEKRDKFAVRFTDEFEHEPKRAGVLVELVLGDDEQGDDIIVEEITGANKLFCLFHNTYRGYANDIIGMKPEKMQEYLNLAAVLPIYRIVRKPGADTQKRIVDLIRGFVED